MQKCHVILLVVLLTTAVSSCLPPGNGDGDGNNGTTDVSYDSTGDFGITMGKGEEGDFTELEPGMEMEVVSGFQGGWHVEPALRMTDVTDNSFITVVSYTATDVETDEVISQTPSMYRIDAGAWDMDGSAYVRFGDQVRFDIASASEAAGRTVELRVRVEIEGEGFVIDASTVDLVDEVDELEGPQPG